MTTFDSLIVLRDVLESDSGIDPESVVRMPC